MHMRGLMEAISRLEALKIFSDAGIDASKLDADGLKSAYRKLAMQYHPDRGGDLSKAQMINAAYDVLKNGSGSRLGDDDDGSSRSGHTETPEWAWAGYSGGMPPSSSIYRNNYTDMNFFKKRMWELSDHSRQQWTIQQYDGAYFRHILTVFGSPAIFRDMADAMLVWGASGNPYNTRAIFVSRAKGGDKTLYCIYADGVFYDKDPVPFEHDSFNMNPGNDQQFVRKLPEMLDRLAADHAHETPALEGFDEDETDGSDYPVFRVTLVARDIQVSAANETEAYKNATEDAREFSDQWDYEVDSVEPSPLDADEYDEDNYNLEVERIGKGRNPYTFNAMFEVDVQAETPEAAGPEAIQAMKSPRW